MSASRLHVPAWRNEAVPRWLSVLAAGVVTLVAAGGAALFANDAHLKLTAAGQAPFVDWRTYALAAERFLAGEPLYAAAQLSGDYLMPRVVSIGYSYPPPSVLLFVPFQSAPLGLAAWLALNAGLLVSGVAAMLRQAFRLPWPWAVALTAVSLAPFYPFAQGIAVGNVNVGLAGLMAWYWVAGRGRWTGVAAGIGATIKVFPGFFALWSARRDGVQPVIVAAGTAVGLAVVTLPLFGIGTWIDFVTALANQRPTCWDGTISIACLLEPSLGPQAGKLIGIGLAVVFALGVVLARSPFVAFSCLAWAMLAPVTDGWAHYWLFVYVAIMAGLGYLATRSSARRTKLQQEVTGASPA